MKIRTKVTLGVVASLVLSAAVGVTLIFSTLRVSNINEDRQLAIDVTESTQGLRSAMLDYVSAPSAQTYAALESASKTIDENVGRLAQRNTASERKSYLARTTGSNAEVGSLIKTLSPDAGPGSESLTIENIRRSSDEMLAATQSLRSSIVNELTTAEFTETIVIIVFIVLTAIILMGIAILVVRSVARPLAELEAGTRVLAGGDFGHRIEIDRRDEIGELADSFNKMAARLRGSFDALETEVTERKRAQEALQEKNAELEGYAHTVSHDIKSPIATIGFAAYTLNGLLSQQPSDETRAGILSIAEMISEKVKVVGELINEILALSEARQVPTEVAEVDVAEVVEQVFSENTWAIERKDIRLDVADDLGSLRASPTHIYQVFSNLITNAIKYNDNEDPLIRIEALGKDDGGGHRYRVSDNGPGIPEEDIENVFIPFYKSGKGGTGIGLATVSRILAVYGGSIRAFNQNGANFEFTINDIQGRSSR